MTQVFITHGYTANGNKHWFPWLETELAKLGIPCKRLNMPDSEHPTPEAWLAHHQQEIVLTPETILIGHSLGCIASLNFLATAQKPIKALILVSGFGEKLPHLPELDSFANFFQNLTACVPSQCYVIAARNDSIVPAEFSQRLAENLQASYLCLPTGGHFLDREGVTTLPEVLDLIRKIEQI